MECEEIRVDLGKVSAKHSAERQRSAQLLFQLIAWSEKDLRQQRLALFGFHGVLYNHGIIICRPHGTVLIQRLELFHFIDSQLKIKNIQIFFHALGTEVGDANGSDFTFVV